MFAARDRRAAPAMAMANAVAVVPAVTPAKAGVQSAVAGLDGDPLTIRSSTALSAEVKRLPGQGRWMNERRYSVYIMASRRNGTLYVGVTNHLGARAFQHRNGVGSQFTTKYGVKTLVWYEHYGDVREAIAREKQLKKWERRWKLELIERFNPEWLDLYETLNN